MFSSFFAVFSLFLSLFSIKFTSFRFSKPCLFSVLEKQSIDCSNPRISSFYPRISLTESAHRPCATIDSYIIFSAPKSLSRMGSEAYFDVIDDEKNNKLNHLLKMRVAGE